MLRKMPQNQLSIHCTRQYFSFDFYKVHDTHSQLKHFNQIFSELNYKDPQDIHQAMSKLSFLSQIQRKLSGTTIPVINVHGTIKQSLTDHVEKRLKNINPSTAVALAVSINSPGGLPVQSQIICNKIKKFANEHNLKIYTFAHDVAASGGYFVLSIGHHTYADRTSVVGSIGVVITKLQLKGILQATSLENKSLTSNDKLIHSIMNNFEDLTEQGRAYLEEVCKYSHGKFINHVKAHRGNKLQIDDKIFSGEIYTGQEAVKNGLVDDIGSMTKVLQQKFPGSSLDFQQQQSKLQKIMNSLV